MEKIFISTILFIGILVIVFLLGPKPKIDTHIKPIHLPADLDQYLAESESRYSDIIPGTEKTIIWANDRKNKTPLSIVYLHGYSATWQEIAPLSNELAAELNTNLFYTRLSGHGRSGAAMAEPTVNDWLNDAMEAFEIGRRLGDKVIIIGTSTGCPLAIWLAERSDTDDALAYVLISPNFAPRDSKSEILTLPWARQFAPLILGSTYSWTPYNEGHARYWTHNYPSAALVTMMGLVKFVRETDFGSIKKPVLVIYSPKDNVINPQEVERKFVQIGSEVKEIQPIVNNGDPDNHVLAGDILAPNNTETVKKLILNFISRLQ
jgi:esterase/lipase